MVSVSSQRKQGQRVELVRVAVDVTSMLVSRARRMRGKSAGDVAFDFMLRVQRAMSTYGAAPLFVKDGYGEMSVRDVALPRDLPRRIELTSAFERLAVDAGYRVVQARREASAQAAFLCSTGDVDVVASSREALLFGAPRVWLKFPRYRGEVVLEEEVSFNKCVSVQHWRCAAIVAGLGKRAPAVPGFEGDVRHAAERVGESGSMQAFLDKYAPDRDHAVWLHAVQAYTAPAVWQRPFFGVPALN